MEKSLQQQANIAAKILEDRAVRYALFPSEIFDEFAWNMLLHLFIAKQKDEDMSEDRLIKLANSGTREGQRWLYQLAKDGQINDRKAGQTVCLTDDGLKRLSEYLDGANLE